MPSLVLLLALALPAAAFVHPKTAETYLSELNYPSEEHTIVTEDGYKLKAFRIPKAGGTPIIVMHGMMATADMWVLMDKEQNLVTIFSDEGYDIWLLNQRGNVYSREHTSMSVSSGNYDYWNFSVEEIAMRDLPAAMDYVMQTTGHNKMFYLGHSMGGLAFAILCSSMPEYCRDRLEGAILLAPFVYPPEQVKLLPIRFITQNARALAYTLKISGSYEFMGRSQFVPNYLYNNCLLDNGICATFLRGLNFNTHEEKKLFRPMVDNIASILGGTSVKVFQHLAYILHYSGKKVGPLPRSWEASSSATNETYNLKNIDIPVAIYYSEDDIFIDDQAINLLVSDLKNVVINRKIPAPFRHLGYCFNLKENYQLVNSMLEFLNKYDSSRRPTSLN